MKHGNRRSLLAVAMLVGIDLACESARGAAAMVYELHIGAQPLDAALQEFARQSGVQILFLSRLADGYRSAPLQGSYTVDAGLRALLAQSRLTYRWINAKTVEIIPLRTAPAN